MENDQEKPTVSSPTCTALLCGCDICTPYLPQGICAPMQPIGWCVRCGKPGTIEQFESLNEQTKSFLMTQNFRAS